MKKKVVQRGEEWCVTTMDGKTIACHPTKERALAQLRAIEANKEINPKRVSVWDCLQVFK